MNDTNPYQDLGLDQILQITGSDAAHAPDLREQGRGMRLLSDKLDEGISALEAARAGTETGFVGVTAQQMTHRTNRLMIRSNQGAEQLRLQPNIFEDLSNQAEMTHQRMLDLRAERQEKLAASPAKKHPAIHAEYDGEARQYMRQTTNGYIDSLRSSEWMKHYAGPRKARRAEEDGPKGFEDRTTPGPSLGQGDAGGPRLQSGTSGGTSGAVLGSESQSAVNNMQSQGRPQSLFGFGMAKGGKLNKAKKRKSKRSDAVESESDVFKPKQAVTPPVIGGRETVDTPPESGPTQRSDGLVPPVIGARPPMGFAGMSQSGGNAGSARPAAPQPPRLASPTRTFGDSSAGARVAPRHPHPAEGRVFRSGTEPRETPEAPAYTWEPKLRHGDEDNPNRSVIRNSRAFAAEPQSQTPSETVRPLNSSDEHTPYNQSEWQPKRPVVSSVIRGHRPVESIEEQDHDPGPFLTNYNLGRNS